MAKRSAKQREQLKTVQAAAHKNALEYGFRMSPHIARWEADGMTQREIVELLNEAGAVVPSEYTGQLIAPVPVKRWTLVQYQRLKKHSEEAKERMAFWAKKNGRTHTRPGRDGAGLFADPFAAGLDHDPNHEPLPPLDRMTLRQAEKAGYTQDQWRKACLTLRAEDLQYVRNRLALIEDDSTDDPPLTHDPDWPHLPFPGKSATFDDWNAFYRKRAAAEKERAAARKRPEAVAQRRAEKEAKRLAAAARVAAQVEVAAYLAAEKERLKDPAYRKLKGRYDRKWWADVQECYAQRPQAKSEQAAWQERLMEFLESPLAPAWPPEKPPRARSKK